MSLPVQETPPAPPAFTPPGSQADLDRIIGDRLAREREKFAGFADLKVKADKFDAAEAKNKTDLQIAQDATAAAEQRATLAEQKAAKADVALTKGVPVNLLAGITKEELEASADALLAFRGNTTPPPTPPPAHVPALVPGREGGGRASSVAQVMEERAAAREAKKKTS